MQDPRRKLLGKRKKKKICRFRHAFSPKPALPQLCVYAKSTTESKRRGKGEWERERELGEEGVGGQERRRAKEKGASEREQKGGKERIRVGAVKKE